MTDLLPAVLTLAAADLLEVHPSPDHPGLLFESPPCAARADSRALFELDGHEVEVTDGVARPLQPEGDVFFGLEFGTNGTAAQARRECVRGVVTWKRHNHRPATGMTLTPPSLSCSSELTISELLR